MTDEVRERFWELDKEEEEICRQAEKELRPNASHNQRLSKQEYLMELFEEQMEQGKGKGPWVKKGNEPGYLDSEDE